MRVKVSPSYLTQIRSLVSNGYSQAQIAERLGTSKRRIGYLMRRYNLCLLRYGIYLEPHGVHKRNLAAAASGHMEIYVCVTVDGEPVREKRNATLEQLEELTKYVRGLHEQAIADMIGSLSKTP